MFGAIENSIAMTLLYNVYKPTSIPDSVSTVVAKFQTTFRGQIHNSNKQLIELSSMIHSKCSP